MRRLLVENADFRRLFLAHSISRAGDAFNTVGLVVLVFDLTGSGLGVGTVAFEVLPILLLGPLVGLAVDRFPRRSVMVVADLGRAGLTVLLAAAGDSVLVAYGVAFGLSALTQAFNPAASSTLPDTMEANELVDANTVLWTTAVVAQIVLAPLASVLIVVFGAGLAFTTNAASYLISAASLRSLQVGRSPATVVQQGWRSAFEGVQVVRGHPRLARLAVVQVLAALSAGATSALMVMLAAERLDIGPSGFGSFWAPSGLVPPSGRSCCAAGSARTRGAGCSGRLPSGLASTSSWQPPRQQWWPAQRWCCSGWPRRPA